MPIIKTLKIMGKQDRERFKIPKSVQQVIPIEKVWKDGIFQQGHKFSKSYRFTDINYAIASKEDKTGMFLDYSEFLNALDSGATTKITINNRKLNKAEFERSILLPMKQDGLDHFRKEYNDMLLSKITGTNNSTIQEKYITISVYKKDIDEAESFFTRVGTDIISHMAQLSSVVEPLNLPDRLSILRDFLKSGEEAGYAFNLKEFQKKGHDFKDWMCPNSMEFEQDCFKIDNRYGRVLYLKDYATYIPYDMEQQRKETKEMLDDLTTRDQRMMYGLVTLVHTADTKEQLDNDTDTLLSIARKNLCQLATLRWQQADGLSTALPYGVRRLKTHRTLTTESTAVLVPFKVQEIMHPGGVYFGQNAVSNNMIFIDRRALLNGNSFRLGVSGSGKSFISKEDMVALALSTDDEIICLDPESEFGKLTRELGGEVIEISATSDTHINALDMDMAYGEGRNPLIEKSQFVLSLFEQLVGAGNLSAQDKSILDRCVADVYRDYIKSEGSIPPPTLKDLYTSLMIQPEEEARGLALSSELFINGSLNTFARYACINCPDLKRCTESRNHQKFVMKHI